MLRQAFSKGVDCTVIFLVGLFLFTIGLKHQEVVGFDSRLYAFALEMWRHGFGWFPRTFKQYYPDYPVTAPFMIYVAAACFGTLNKLIAVLPSAVAAALTLVVTYLIGALENQRWGRMAVIFLLFTAEFVREARAISFDQYITLITASCFYLVYSGERLAKSMRGYWVIPLFVLGFAFRGPIGLVIPTGVVVIYYLIEKKIRRCLLMGVVSGVLLVLCTSVLLALAYHTGGSAFLQEVLHTEVLNHITDLKSNPFHFYFIESIGAYAVTYPLMLFMLPGLYWQYRQHRLGEESRFLMHLLGWIAVVLIGLSIPDDKKIRYILSMAPALALFCSYLFVFQMNAMYLRVVKKIMYWICYFFPTLCLFILLFSHKKLALDELNYPILIGLLVLLQVVILGCYLYSRTEKAWVILLAALTFIMAYISVVEPINRSVNGARHFVSQLEAIRAKEHARLVFYREGWDGLAVKYYINLPAETPLYFINTPAELLAYPPDAIFVASIEYVNALPLAVSRQFRQIMSGEIGHDEVIVFKRKD